MAMRSAPWHRRRALGLFALGGIAACGDPILPSDFSGPPAGEVSGTVVEGASGAPKDADQPRLSLEWLNLGPGAPALVGQVLFYQRSEKLKSDWDIGLSTPSESAKFDIVVGSRRVRIAVGKMVYYDDRVPDGRLDWSCATSTCDRVKAVSTQ